jgi:hypothetical protein
MKIPRYQRSMIVTTGCIVALSLTAGAVDMMVSIANTESATLSYQQNYSSSAQTTYQQEINEYEQQIAAELGK